LRQGFPVVGDSQRSGCWPPFVYKPKLQFLHLKPPWIGPGSFDGKIFRRCNSVPVSDQLMSLWKATMEDVMEGSTVGPFGSEADVADFSGCSYWIPTQRLEVVQKNTVRGCDSATSNLINKTTAITEKLRSSSSPRRTWISQFCVSCVPGVAAVIVGYFVMIGHSFGLVAAVYNYNCRSAMINDVFVQIFEMVAFNFYDDKYGFETDLTAPPAKFANETIHALFDEKKLQLSRSPVILGVTFNLEALVLGIKDQRQQELLETIDSVRGWTSVLPPLSECQSMKDLRSDHMEVNPAIARSPRFWRRLIQLGPPREISLRAPKSSDLVIFTDGFTPDRRKEEAGPDRIGAVVLDRRAPAPKQFSGIIPSEISEKWLKRKTQIVPIEMIAPILVLETFRDHLRDRMFFF
ncbi:unnamed protein product, partial [Symbiodinium sp. CCMP2456]